MQSEPVQPCSAKGQRITVIVSGYHSQITKNLADAAEATFINAGGLETDFNIITAAGAWELPVLARSIARLDTVDAIVALGCIITGETTHDRIIADAIAEGLMTIALEWGHPVSMGILTCKTMEQAKARSGGECGNKGTEAMTATIGTVNTLKEINAS
jgi:6,7-dimethyl-8-ribityllumazine synthase